MWRYNEVLEIFTEVEKICFETANKALNSITNRAFHFVKGGNISEYSRKNSTDNFAFPTRIALMTQRLDIVIWSVKLKTFSLLS